MNQENSTPEWTAIETAEQVEEIVLSADEQDESDEERTRYYEFFRH